MSLHRLNTGLRHNHPAEPPTRHTEEFREAVDDQCLGFDFERGRDLALITDTVINLVRDQLHRTTSADVGDLLQGGTACDRAGRVSGTRDDDPPGSRCMRLNQLRSKSVSTLAGAIELNGNSAQGAERIAVGRVTRSRK